MRWPLWPLQRLQHLRVVLHPIILHPIILHPVALPVREQRRRVQPHREAALVENRFVRLVYA
jgi:hypothetical protein